MTSRRAAAGAIALYTGMAVLMFWSAWSGPPDTYIGIAGDAQTHMWYLSWVPYALTHMRDPLISTYLGYPRGMSVMWNNVDAFPVTSMLLAPVTRAVGLVLNYNIISTASLVVSATAAYFAVLRFVRSRVAAFCGGALYGFSPYMTAHSIGHTGFTFAFVPPLILLLGHEVLVRRKWPPLLAGVAAGILLACQLLIAEEYVATIALFAVVAAAVAAALNPARVRDSIAPVVQALIGASIGFVPLAALPIGLMFLGPQRIHGTVRVQDLYVNDLLNFVLPTPLHLVRPAWTQPIVAQFTGNASEWNGYIGIALLAVLILVVVSRWSLPAVRFAAIVATLIAVFSLGPHLHVGGHVTGIPLLWHVGRIPVLQQILPSRLMMYFYLFAGILLAFYVEAVGVVRRWVTRAAGVALLFAAVVLLLPLWPYPATRTPIPSFFRTNLVERVPDGSVALVAPFARINYDAMEWQAVAAMRFRIPEGNYLAPGPSGGAIVGPWPNALSDVMEGIYNGNAAPPLDATTRAQMLDGFRQMGAQEVIVGPMPHQDWMVDLFSNLYGRPPDSVGGVYLWLGVPGP